jgi:N-acyl-D-aspartate/D-glutamate deacylase
MLRLSKETQRPITFALLQNDMDPTQWRRLLEATDRAAAEGARITPQVAARPTGLLMGLDSKAHPFNSHKTYLALLSLPLAERVRTMKDPEVRRRILEEDVQFADPLTAFVCTAFHKLFPLGSPPNYEPSPEQSVAALAQRQGRDPREVAYDLLLEQDGKALLYFPILNYSDVSFEPIREMLLHPRTVLGLSDGGAHCGLICDAGTPTFLLTHWVRDRSRGDRLPLEYMVRRQTKDTAEFYDLHDRGALAPGMLADLNLIDFDSLALGMPQLIFDLPANGRRLIQKADGYKMTVKRGEVIFEDGEPTGSLPGKLVRGPQQAP